MVTTREVTVPVEAVPLLAALDRLRIDLIEAAWVLDTRGQHQAADIAMNLSAQLAELVGRPGGIVGSDEASLASRQGDLPAHRGISKRDFRREPDWGGVDFTSFG